MKVRCRVEMETRFGPGVSLEDVEAFDLNRTLEEMKEFAKRKEEQRYQDIQGREVSPLILVDTPASGFKNRGTNICRCHGTARSQPVLLCTAGSNPQGAERLEDVHLGQHGADGHQDQLDRRERPASAQDGRHGRRIEPGTNGRRPL